MHGTKIAPKEMTSMMSMIHTNTAGHLPRPGSGFGHLVPHPRLEIPAAAGCRNESGCLLYY